VRSGLPFHGNLVAQCRRNGGGDNQIGEFVLRVPMQRHTRPVQTVEQIDPVDEAGGLVLTDFHRGEPLTTDIRLALTCVRGMVTQS